MSLSKIPSPSNEPEESLTRSVLSLPDLTRSGNANDSPNRNSSSNNNDSNSNNAANNESGSNAAPPSSSSILPSFFARHQQQQPERSSPTPRNSDNLTRPGASPNSPLLRPLSTPILPSTRRSHRHHPSTDSATPPGANRPRTSSSARRAPAAAPTKPKKSHRPVPLEWIQLSNKTFPDGRVLMIDYISQAHSRPGYRQVQAKEFNNVVELREFYDNRSSAPPSALRLIHVQNAPWARQYLLRKFNINHRDGLLGTDFGKWAEFSRPQHYGGKPVLKGKVFPSKPDPWRKVVRGAFGLDYLRAVPHFRWEFKKLVESSSDSHLAQPPSSPSYRQKAKEVLSRRSSSSSGSSSLSADEKQKALDMYRLLNLNNYDEDDNVTTHSEVFVQRLSVYIQRRQEDLVVPDGIGIKNPYLAAMRAMQRSKETAMAAKESSDSGEGPSRDLPSSHFPHGPFDDANYFPIVDSLDNDNVIIIFDDSHTESLNDTLIAARREVETTWIRLLMYLNLEELRTDEDVALECMDLIINDIFLSLENSWEKFLDRCDSHMDILQNDLYSNPADESRAGELWLNSKCWMIVNRLAIIHTTMIPNVMSLLRDMTQTVPPSGEWMSGMIQSFSKVPSLVQEILVKPTDNLNDLLHKSVQIRDARHSIRQGASMWRLSWITFIFLPLTFTASFFDMNSDAFPQGTIVKWFFIASVPFMFLVLVGWYVMKHTVTSERNSPSYRRVYTEVFEQLAADHPLVWSNVGARPEVAPKGWWKKVKWRLVRRWFDRQRIYQAVNYDPARPSIGLWSRLKCVLTKRWVAQVDSMDQIMLAEQGQHLMGASGEHERYGRHGPHSRHGPHGDQEYPTHFDETQPPRFKRPTGRTLVDPDPNPVQSGPAAYPQPSEDADMIEYAGRTSGKIPYSNPLPTAVSRTAKTYAATPEVRTVPVFKEYPPSSPASASAPIHSSRVAHIPLAQPARPPSDPAIVSAPDTPPPPQEVPDSDGMLLFKEHGRGKMALHPGVVVEHQGRSKMKETIDSSVVANMAAAAASSRKDRARPLVQERSSGQEQGLERAREQPRRGSATQRATAWLRSRNRLSAREASYDEEDNDRYDNKAYSSCDEIDVEFNHGFSGEDLDSNDEADVSRRQTRAREQDQRRSQPRRNAGDKDNGRHRSTASRPSAGLGLISPSIRIRRKSGGETFSDSPARRSRLNIASFTGLRVTPASSITHDEVDEAEERDEDGGGDHRDRDNHADDERVVGLSLIHSHQGRHGEGSAHSAPAELLSVASPRDPDLTA